MCTPGSNKNLICFHDRNLSGSGARSPAPGGWAEGLGLGAPESSYPEDLCGPTVCKGG